MARSRVLHPSFFTDEAIVQVSAFARLLFQGLWCEADRLGRLEDKPIVLKMRLFPADAVDVPALLNELVSVGLVERYEAEGKRLLLVPGFAEHQHVHPKEAPSKLPGPATTKQEVTPPPVMHEAKARESASSMKPKPGKAPHETGVSPSASTSTSTSTSKECGPVAFAPVPESKKLKPEKTTDPRHHPLKLALIEAFAAAGFGVYAFDGRDGAAVASLLAKGGPEEALRRWERALRRNNFPTVRAIWELAHHWPHFATDTPAAPSRPGAPAAPTITSGQELTL